MILRVTLGCEPLMWHDAVAAMEGEALHRFFDARVACVVWDYTPSLSPASMAFARMVAAWPFTDGMNHELFVMHDS